jgi:Na+/H+ antiporter NhaD/arsenite permease-like protein
MNDTLAIIGTPLVLMLARTHQLPPRLLLLALAFGVTIGSTMSPIGNPQNLLIALRGGMASPFVDFSVYLGPPTLINLLLAYAALRIAFRRHFHRRSLVHAPLATSDRRLARLARWGLGMLVALVGLRVTLAAAGAPWLPPLTWIGLAAATPLLLARRRRELLRGVDWQTLLFFVALFVLMRSVWDSGLLQHWLPTGSPELGTILGISVLGSQLISNVPLVALLLPLLAHAGPVTLLALAAGSTIAGNLTLIGAASNVIIVQRAERSGFHLGFWEFFALGAPLTLANLAVYWIWLRWVAD